MTTTEPVEQEHASPAPTSGFDVTVYLKGGAYFTVRVAEWSISRNQITSGLHSLSWEHIPDHPRLRYLNLESVAAIVVADAPTGPDTNEPQT